MNQTTAMQRIHNYFNSQCPLWFQSEEVLI